MGWSFKLRAQQGRGGYFGMQQRRSGESKEQLQRERLKIVGNPIHGLQSGNA
jgi:hypothetical protein